LKTRNFKFKKTRFQLGKNRTVKITMCFQVVMHTFQYCCRLPLSDFLSIFREKFRSSQKKKKKSNAKTIFFHCFYLIFLKEVPTLTLDIWDSLTLVFFLEFFSKEKLRSEDKKNERSPYVS